MNFFLRHWWKKYKVEIILFCLGFGIRFTYALTIKHFFGPHVFTGYSDSEEFVRVAHNILEHRIMSQSHSAPFVPDSLRLPLYPFFLAFLFWLKFPIFAIIVLQNIMAGIMSVLVYKIGYVVFSTQASSILAAVLFSFEPAAIYWNNLLMSDVVFSFLLLLAIFYFVSKKFFLFSFVLSLATLTRLLSLYFFPLFLIIFVIKSKKDRQLVFKKSLLICTIFILTLSPWIIRNKIVFNTWELSTVGWVNTYFYTINRFAQEHKLSTPMPVMPADYPGQNSVIFSYDFRNASFYREHILNIVKVQPLSYIIFHLRSSIQGLNNHDYEYLIQRVFIYKVPSFNILLIKILPEVGKWFWWAVYGLVIFGFIIKRKGIYHWLLILLYVINSFLLGYSAVLGGGRYTMPVIPIILILGSYGMLATAGSIRDHKQFFTKNV